MLEHQVCVRLTCFSSLFQQKKHWLNNDPVALQMWRGYHNKEVLSKYATHGAKGCTLYQESTSCQDLRSSFCNSSASQSNDQCSISRYEMSSRRHRVSLQLQQCADCVALTLRDLAEPEFFSIDCSVKIHVNILCSLPTQLTSNNTSAQRQTGSSTFFCQRGNVFMNQTCYNFLWQRNCTNKELACFQEIDLLGYLYTAVKVSHFPPIYIHNCMTSTPRRFYDIVKILFDRNSSDEAFCLITNRPSETSITENVFKCEEGSLISAQYVCDGIKNCPDSSDDMNCECQTDANFRKTCSFFPSISQKKSCSPLYNCTKDKCTVYNDVFSYGKDSHDLQVTKNTFHCNSSGIKIGRELVDDLVPDCPSGEDEVLLKLIFSGSVHLKCSKHGQIPCRDGHSRCFYAHEICSYELDKYGHLTPCRTGEHLQNCKEFECNSKFKCPGLYCIPWSYVCDSKWDCASGADESTFHDCTPDRKCFSLFKCRRSAKCLHLLDLCDNHFDCPEKDDELFCSLQHTVCPNDCVCLTVALHCKQISTSMRITNQLVSFVVIHLIDSKFPDIRDKELSQAFILVIQNCSLYDICSPINTGSRLQHLNVAWNHITQLTPTCFLDALLLRNVHLQHNLLSMVPSRIFETVTNLMVLNLSSNPIQELMHSAFEPLPKLKILSILNMTLNRKKHNVFTLLDLQLLEVADFELCCLIQCTSCCSQSTPWYYSCVLLNNEAIRGTFIGVSILLLLTNTLSIKLQRLSYMKRLEKSGAFGSMVVVINVYDLVHTFLFFMLWIADLDFLTNFGLLSAEWRKSPECYVQFGIMTHVSTCSPLLLTFFAVSRLMLVKYPLETRFKETKFVIRWMSLISLLCFAYSVLLTISSWLVNTFLYDRGIPTSICSPFVDPTHNSVITIVITSITILIQLSAAVATIVLQTKLVLALVEHQQKLQGAVSKETSNIPMIVQFVAISTSNVICWLPTGILYVTLMVLKEYSFVIVPWFTITLQPVNSLVIPIVFIVTTIRKILAAK